MTDSHREGCFQLGSFHELEKSGFSYQAYSSSVVNDARLLTQLGLLQVPRAQQSYHSELTSYFTYLHPIRSRPIQTYQKLVSSPNLPN